MWGLVRRSVLSCVLVVLLAIPTFARASAPEPGVASGRIVDVYVREPRGYQGASPVRVLVTLHGMGGSGRDFAQGFVEQADANNWRIVAPTIAYGDWRDPQQVAAEDPELIGWLAAYLEGVAADVGWPRLRRIFVLGHSRGAQLALRFAFVYPEKVMGVAALSAGTYTLPRTLNDRGATLEFPYGVGDLVPRTGRGFDAEKVDNVSFWVGVGAEDNNPNDVPRNWDTYLGNNRVARAQAFQQAMEEAGATSVITLFPGATHNLTDEMRRAACQFLQSVAEAEASAALISLEAGQ